ncbi:MAG: CHASE3 domain-containing protein [Gammaproteobacteria bacterium]
MNPDRGSPRHPFGAALLMLGGLAVFVLVAFFSHQTLRAMDEATRLRAQARESLLTSARVLSLLKDVETGQRGYVLTGDLVYLGPYTVGLAQVGEAFARLVQGLAHLPVTAAPLDGLDDLIERRLGRARDIVEARKQQGFDAAQRAILSDEGRQLMDAIRGRFADLERLQRAEIDRRNREVVMLKRRAFWVNGALILLGIGLVAAGYVMLWRERQRRARAERALLDVNASLETAVAQRTAELERARSEIEAFALRLDQSVEAERRRLAREVHDQLGQVFTALKMTLNAPFSHTAANDTTARMNVLLGEGIATARRIAAELRPPLLDDLGLGAALAHRAQRFAEETGVACETAVEGDAYLPTDRATQLYRIAQEALTNVARHAAASRVWIEGKAADGQYWLAVEDNGHGMPGTIPPGSHGLRNMRERAALAGGRLELAPGRDGGLRVLVRLPLESREEEIACTS